MKELILEYIKNEYLDEDEAADMKLDEHTPLISSGIVDSLQHGQPEAVSREENGISIPDEEPRPGLDTVASIMVLVNKHLAKKGA